MTGEAPAVPLPMFPLGSVLFPAMPLGLHVFEPRYRALVTDCLRNRQEFGVVLIERGSEVGGGDARFPVGTVARITAAGELPDGRWLLEAVGDRRIRVAAWLPDDPYPLALVQDLPDDGPPDRRALDVAEQAVRRALALKSELDEPAAPAAARLDDDPRRAAYQLAAIAPIGPLDQQLLLALDDATARMRELARLADDAARMLAYRLSGG